MKRFEDPIKEINSFQKALEDNELNLIKTEIKETLNKALDKTDKISVMQIQRKLKVGFVLTVRFFQILEIKNI